MQWNAGVRAGVLQPLWGEGVLDAGVQKIAGCLGTLDEGVMRHVSFVGAQCADSFKVSDCERVTNVVASHKARWLMGDACNDVGCVWSLQ